MCDENRNEAPFTEEQNQQMIDNGMIATVNAPHNIHCLSIIGQIEGHFLLPPQTKTTKYEHLIPALAAIEQDSTVEGLMVVLNTVGGDVEAGLAIAEMIAGMSKPSVSIVLAGGQHRRELYSSVGYDDDTPGPHERHGARSSADNDVVPENAGQDNAVCDRKQPHEAGALP